MSEHALVSIAVVVVLGAAAQWLAWRVGLPSILLLLLCGFVAGPATGLVDPDQLLGDLLLPFVSMSVALILYEGGLSLKFSDLTGVGHVLRNLVLVGALITWAVSAVGAHLLFDLDVGLSVLLGAILVVTGPTVIVPLLQHIRPSGPVGSILKWEGIVIDPIGALLAVLVFEVILVADPAGASLHVVGAIGKTVVVGGGLGLIAAFLLVLVIHRYWVPDFLQNAVSLMFVVATFAAANSVQHESGLFAATVMGIALANQKTVDVRHIVEFKENLRVLLLSLLFIFLAARLRLQDLTQVAVSGIIFVILLAVIARPLAVWASTLGSRLNGRERVFLACMAPRGIVAAAVASIFALRLQEAGHQQAEVLVPVTFTVIVWTVVVYGLVSPLLARRLGVADSDPQGVLFVGASSWVRALAETLHARGYRVLMVDSNRSHTAAARMAGLPTFTGSALADYALDEMDLGGIGRLLAVTPNEWVNVLAVQRFQRIFGQSQCYQLPPADPSAKTRVHHRHLHGRWLFGPTVTDSELDRRLAAGATIKATPLTEEFGFEEFRSMYGQKAVPMVVINEDGTMAVITADKQPDLHSGQTLVALVQDPQA